MPAPPSRRIIVVAEADVKWHRVRRPKPVDADYESLLEYTGFYDVYYDAVREELWTSTAGTEGTPRTTRAERPLRG
jgi:hypothetical protein